MLHRESDSWVDGGDEMRFPKQVLIDAGVHDEKGGCPSRAVLEHLGEQRIEALRNRHGDAWCAAAEYEFCVLTMSHNAPPFIAAECIHSLVVSGTASRPHDRGVS